MTDERKVHTMPKQWGYPFAAAWRVFERTLNPAFIFLIKCTNCGSTGPPSIGFVMSKKKPKAMLGLECGNCLQTVKFSGLIDPEAEDFPARLLTKPGTVLDGKKGDRLDSEGYLELMFGDD